MPGFPARDLPAPLAALGELASDLRWTWSHEADALWQLVDADAWARTRNPWVILQDMSDARLDALAQDEAFRGELDRLARARRAYLETPGWYVSTYGRSALSGIAYFSMEFGLGEALPLYAGGLGILAGDYLKTASDLGLPVVGIGLLYQEGYFRQTVDRTGWQREVFPFNDPGSLPIRPAIGSDGAWFHVGLDLPGRRVQLRVWQALIGRVVLYLLDSNDPFNEPADRGITSRLYHADTEIRFLQEIVLGVAGWRVIEALAPDVEICHLNEGHAAFVVIERARSLMRRLGLSFREAMWAARAGNVFTTHTPVAAGFDRFPPQLIDVYSRYLEHFRQEIDVPLSEILALGRIDPANNREPFNMAYLALRGSLKTNGVSRRHEQVSRGIFQPLFARWPRAAVPVGHVTNGVHVPTWDSPGADELWTRACGKERWRCVPDSLAAQLATLSDEALWAMTGTERQALVRGVRGRLKRQLGARGLAPEMVARADQVLDPNVLTLGFARRFTAYKRPNLLLHDIDRLGRLLTDPARPAQLVIAGKAHPSDDQGKRMIREWIVLAQRPEFRQRVVFVEDYDIMLAQELVQGVDVWINTPRPPWEACGTSGMKVLVNGGINLSQTDGWWEEAYAPELGWAIGDGEAVGDGERDRRDAGALYAILENEVIPEFYARDAAGLPRRWLARVRQSLANLTPRYSSNRMVGEYIEQLYLPCAEEYRRRIAENGAAARAITAWEARLRHSWASLHIGEPTIAERDRTANDRTLELSVPVYLGDIDAEAVRVEIYADARDGAQPLSAPMKRGAAIPGAVNGYLFEGAVPNARASGDYTVRVLPTYPGVHIPTELPLILWQH